MNCLRALDGLARRTNERASPWFGHAQKNVQHVRVRVLDSCAFMIVCVVIHNEYSAPPLFFIFFSEGERNRDFAAQPMFNSIGPTQWV